MIKMTDSIDNHYCEYKYYTLSHACHNLIV